LKIRAVGENPASADTSGVSVPKVRYASLLIGTALAGLGGAVLTVVQLNLFREGIIAGRSWIAIALVIFASWILYGMTAASVIVLRVKKPELPRPYRLKLYPLIPFLFIAGSIVLIITTAVQRPRESAMGIGLIVLGLPFYFHWKRVRSREF
jgi:ABC-type uncharacterized transport system permease subunit